MDDGSPPRPEAGSPTRDDLLERLRIARDPVSPRGAARSRWLGASRRALAAAGAGVVILIAVAGGVALVAGRTAPVDVRVAAATSINPGAASGAFLDASGYVVARRQATVSSKITGRVKDVFIEEGQHVRAGQVLALLDDSTYRAGLQRAEAEAAEAEANAALASARAAQARPHRDRYERGYAAEVVTAQELDNARNDFDAAQLTAELAKRHVAVLRAGVALARRNLEDTVVRAPFDGVVTAKAAQPGEIVAPVAGGGFTRTGIGTIVDMDSLEVGVEVGEGFINRVSAGTPAVVRLDAYPGWEIPAKVVAVIPTADRTKATVAVRVALLAKNSRVLPEMAASVAFMPEAAGQAGGAPPAPSLRGVTVPHEAVQQRAGRAFVYVIDDGRAKRRAVQLGSRMPQGQIVLSGLQEGEQLVVSPPADLRDGVSVRAQAPASSKRR